MTIEECKRVGCHYFDGYGCSRSPIWSEDSEVCACDRINETDGGIKGCQEGRRGMTPENAEKKAFLESYKRQKEKVKRIEEKIAECRLKELPGAITYTGMPHGSGANRDLSDYASKLDGLQRELAAERNKKESIKLAISMSIAAVESPKCRELLRRRYICLEGWRRIATEMGCSKDHAKGKLHGAALEMFEIKK